MRKRANVVHSMEPWNHEMHCTVHSVESEIGMECQREYFMVLAKQNRRPQSIHR